MGRNGSYCGLNATKPKGVCKLAPFFLGGPKKLSAEPVKPVGQCNIWPIILLLRALPASADSAFLFFYRGALEVTSWYFLPRNLFTWATKAAKCFILMLYFIYAVTSDGDVSSIWNNCIHGFPGICIIIYIPLFLLGLFISFHCTFFTSKLYKPVLDH